KRILVKKFELGLFENPFKFSDEVREKKYVLTNEHKNTARKMAAQSIVLLKNEGDLLPLKPEVKRIAMIGPMAKAVREHLGFWSIEWPGDSSYIVSPFAGIQSQLPANITLSYAKGCDINSSDTSYFAEAVATAANADVVWLFVGEARDMSGEAKSRAHLGLPGVQHQLIQRLTAANKQIVLVIHAGRPLIFNWERAHVPTIVYAWWLGSETGNALFDVFSGKVNPSGKLPMTFPLTEGQIPIYYNHFNTGRPAKNDADRFYRSAYIDESLYPAYPFGFGLSYAKFEYSNLTISKSTFYKKDTITISCDITNIGDVAGTETIQLYIRDKVASVVRPIKELKAFEQVFIESKKTKKVSFPLSINDFKFYNDALEWIAEPGEFEIMIGSSSADIHLQQRIELLN
ncbi:MAG: glycoside hydrolase family 3 C-terminal domain-containing protein, partial [Chitinophagaceae bacterium]